MTTPDETIQVTSLPNLAQILPYLLGHYPDDSIAFHCPGTGSNFADGPTMTYPLPDDPAQWQQTAKTAASNFIHYAHSRGHSPDQGIIIYLCREPRPGQTPGTPPHSWNRSPTGSPRPCTSTAAPSSKRSDSSRTAGGPSSA